MQGRISFRSFTRRLWVERGTLAQSNWGLVAPSKEARQRICHYRYRSKFGRIAC